MCCPLKGMVGEVILHGLALICWMIMLALHGQMELQ